PGSTWPSPAVPGWSARRSCTWWTAPWKGWWPCRPTACRHRARRSPRPPRRRA
ncbi:XkdX family protein, partial [Dysosmobacter welbionis]